MKAQVEYYFEFSQWCAFAYVNATRFEAFGQTIDSAIENLTWMLQEMKLL